MYLRLNNFAAIAVTLVVGSSVSAQSTPVTNDQLSQYGGTSEASPTTSSTQLNYRICNSSNSDQQALLKINIIGNGVNQIPAGSVITSATLRLRAEVGGDGLLYRAGEVWDSTPTWSEVGDVLTAGSFIGVGLNSGQSMEFDVTSHVQLWANGTSNQGWVIKGDFNNDDCAAARIYNGSASESNRPRLTVIFTPPDTTPPRIIDIEVGSTVSTHADYDIPAGSGEQIRTVAVGKINQIFVQFDEPILNLNETAFSLVSANTGNSYPLANNGITYDPNTVVVTFRLSSPIVASDQLILTIYDAVTDRALPVRNALDGEWSPKPTSLNATGTDSFPSGDGSEGGDLQFYFTVIPADFNHDNVVNGTDEQVQTANYGMASGATHGHGDADGDGDVDGTDFLIWQQQIGTDYTSW